MYATWCNAVEGNTTFYGLPASRTVASWATEAPEGFQVRVQAAPGDHPRAPSLRDVAADHREFLERIAPLGARAEQLSIQLPPSFGPSDLNTLASFVRSLPRSHRYAVELRHQAFYDDPQLEAHVEQLLGEHDVEWISLDTTTLYSEVPPSAAERGARRQKPHLPRRLRALTEHPVVRFVGTDETRTRPAPGGGPGSPVLTGWLAEGRIPTVFVHTPDNIPGAPLAPGCRLTQTSAAGSPPLHRCPSRSRGTRRGADGFPDDPQDTVTVPSRGGMTVDDGGDVDAAATAGGGVWLAPLTPARVTDPSEM